MLSNRAQGVETLLVFGVAIIVVAIVITAIAGPVNEGADSTQNSVQNIYDPAVQGIRDLGKWPVSNNTPAAEVPAGGGTQEGEPTDTGSFSDNQSPPNLNYNGTCINTAPTCFPQFQEVVLIPSAALNPASIKEQPLLSAHDTNIRMRSIEYGVVQDSLSESDGSSWYLVDWYQVLWYHDVQPSGRIEKTYLGSGWTLQNNLTGYNEPARVLQSFVSGTFKYSGHPLTQYVIEGSSDNSDFVDPPYTWVPITEVTSGSDGVIVVTPPYNRDIYQYRAVLKNKWVAPASCVQILPSCGANTSEGSCSSAGCNWVEPITQDENIFSAADYQSFMKLPEPLRSRALAEVTKLEMDYADAWNDIQIGDSETTTDPTASLVGAIRLQWERQKEFYLAQLRIQDRYGLLGLPIADIIAYYEGIWANQVADQDWASAEASFQGKENSVNKASFDDTPWVNCSELPTKFCGVWDVNIIKGYRLASPIIKSLCEDPSQGLGVSKKTSWFTLINLYKCSPDGESRPTAFRVDKRVDVYSEPAEFCNKCQVGSDLVKVGEESAYLLNRKERRSFWEVSGTIVTWLTQSTGSTQPGCESDKPAAAISGNWTEVYDNCVLGKSAYTLDEDIYVLSAQSCGTKTPMSADTSPAETCSSGSFEAISSNYVDGKANVSIANFAGTNNCALTLAWDPSVDPSVSGYNIYYGAGVGGMTNKVNVGNTTNAVIGNLTGGVNYCFAATAYNVLGIESVFSDSVCWTPASPPVCPNKITNPHWEITDQGTFFVFNMQRQVNQSFSVQQSHNGGSTWYNSTATSTSEPSPGGCITDTYRVSGCSQFDSLLFRTRLVVPSPPAP